MSTLLYYSAFTQDNNIICILHSRKPVSDHNTCTSPKFNIKIFADMLFLFSSLGHPNFKLG